MELTQSYLKSVIDYDPSTGVFRWRSRPGRKRFNKMFAGKEAGTINSWGYRVIHIGDKFYKAHRLAWLYCHGSQPKDQIDHINGVKTDNRISNLRDVDQKKNSRNNKIDKRYASSCPGVYWDRKSERWVARVATDEGMKHIGVFNDYFEAVCTRKSAEIANGYHINHGRKQNKLAS